MRDPYTRGKIEILDVEARLDLRPGFFGGQSYEVGYESRKIKTSRAAVKEAVKKEEPKEGGAAARPLISTPPKETGQVLLLENARIGVAQAIRGIVGGGCIDRVVVRGWSLRDRSPRIAAGCTLADRVARVGTGGARSAAYGMPGGQGAACITCGPGGRTSTRR
jgi:hypothetical protein